MNTYVMARTSLIGDFDVAGGFLYASYLNKTRTEDDFCQAICQVVDTASDDRWVFICDGLNIHKSEAMVNAAQACGLDIGLEKRGNPIF